MVQLIKKGGLRERANRSRKYSHSENSIKTLDPHRYRSQDHIDSIKNNTDSQQENEQSDQTQKQTSTQGEQK